MTAVPDEPSDILHPHVEIALDEAACTAGALFEVREADTGRVLAVRADPDEAHHAARQLATRQAEVTAAQLAANGEGHQNFWITLSIQDQDTGALLGAVAIPVPYD